MSAESQGKENPLRFGAEFGPSSVSGTTQGVSLGTFKQLVWLSNVGGLILFVIGLELLLVQGMNLREQVFLMLIFMIIYGHTCHNPLILCLL